MARREARSCDDAHFEDAANDGPRALVGYDHEVLEVAETGGDRLRGLESSLKFVGVVSSTGCVDNGEVEGGYLVKWARMETALDPPSWRR